MDPNLTRIRDANLGRIKRGRLARPIFQAKSYLTYILGHDTDQINKEMDGFVDHMKLMIHSKALGK